MFTCGIGAIYESINLTSATFSEENYTDLLWQRRGIKAWWKDYFKLKKSLS